MKPCANVRMATQAWGLAAAATLCVGLWLALRPGVAAPPSPPPPSSSPSSPSALEMEPVKIDVGGYRLAMRSAGRGSPVVVIDAGLGEPAIESGSWANVVSEMSRRTRVILYDRAGLGTSDPAPAGPRTSDVIAEELHRLLVAAGVPGPYILVGHSIGGFTVRRFAGRYPGDVAGMVLVDSAHPDQWRRWLLALPAQAADEPEDFRRVRGFLESQVSGVTDNPDRLDIGASARSVGATPGLGGIPLAVVSHSPQRRIAPELPEALSAEIEAIGAELQLDLLRLSSNSTHRIAVNAGHAVHGEEPETVVAAIQSVIDVARKNRSAVAP